MSQPLIDRNPDLKRLQDEGYRIQIRNTLLLLFNVPYVNAQKAVVRGTLLAKLTTNGDVVTTRGDHQTYLIGEDPCYANGVRMDAIISGGTIELDKGVTANVQFSCKKKRPDGTIEDYRDFYDKMTRYVEILGGPAAAIDPDVTAKTGPIVPAPAEHCPFAYLDTASGRAGISLVARKVEGLKIAIVGVGGTGSYVLDLVAKTWVKDIHIFDGDEFSTHNAFRAPGAPTLEYLREGVKKVAHFAALYSPMHLGIVPHDCSVTADNVELLRDMDFVFLCMDASDERKIIVDRLEEWGRPFIDAGLGIYHKEEGHFLGGHVRVTTSTRDHRDSRRFIPLDPLSAANEYDRNIQVAELNSLAAAMAVLKWKKHFGLYLDFKGEHDSLYMINSNFLGNQDVKDQPTGEAAAEA